MLVVVGVGVVYCEGQRVVWVGAVDRHERVRWRAVLLLLAGRSRDTSLRESGCRQGRPADASAPGTYY